MSDIKISLVASANRPVLQNGFENWKRFLYSLRGNTIKYEVVFVGDVKPNFPLADFPEFKYIHATVKPAQAYEIGFRAAEGELVGWTADDADYNHPKGCKDSLDLVYNHYKEFETRYGDYKTVIAMRPIEDGGDVYKFHHFFGGWDHTPVMAPFGVLNRKWFVDELGGYDRRFVSGQSENDVIMRVFEDGGRVELCLDCFLYVHHGQVHPRTRDGRREDNKFRQWYNWDREFLESCWVVGGYGHYESHKKDAKISNTRLLPMERFESTADWTTVTQGPKGIWK